MAQAGPAAALDLVVMLGGMGDAPLEALHRRALEAAALDTIEAATGSDRFRGALLLTDRAPEQALPPGTVVEVDREPFHFGRRLAGAVDGHGIERLLYAGAGGGPLLGAQHFEALADGVQAAPAGTAVCVTNNFFSADLFALAPASLLACLDPPPESDNGVPRRLKEECEVEVSELPRGIETQMNLDSPVDLAAMALADAGGPRLRALLHEWAPDTDRMERAAAAFTDRDAEVLIAGRVGSQAWQYLERETACRVRVLAEERGMGAAGRDADGSARSLLGQLIGSVGAERFFAEMLPELCDAAFIDLRPALVHLGWHPSREDRFAADLGLADRIEEPGLRSLVAAAVRAPVPVVLGGHSLVAGALMLLNDWAWSEHDRALGL